MSVYNPETGKLISDLQQETLGPDGSKTKTKIDIPAANIHKSLIGPNDDDVTLPKMVRKHLIITTPFLSSVGAQIDVSFLYICKMKLHVVILLLEDVVQLHETVKREFMNINYNMN